MDVYGQVRLSANSVKTGASPDAKELRDNASRLGFRGGEGLGGGLSVLFGLETGFGADRGSFADTAAPLPPQPRGSEKPLGRPGAGAARFGQPLRVTASTCCGVTCRRRPRACGTGTR